MNQEKLFSQKRLSTLDGIKNRKKVKWLSHSAIEELNRCPRCFWLSYREGIKLPEGIQSRLANRFDQIIKRYFNFYRRQGKIPPMVEDKIAGKLQNPFRESYYCEIDNEYGFYGRLDECLINEKGEHIPIDFKTTSSDPRNKEILDSYQNQIDEYLFLMEENGLKTAGFGYLIYFFPIINLESAADLSMIIHVVKVKRKVKDIKSRIEAAVKVLKSRIPKGSISCSFCRWLAKVRRYCR
ncbi:MAG: PD-(D/E)XK nuclease family protein [Patescibacteria group bacterium]|nr:PD-(D/E)XK nuclease family protein [Patescibacteria group bacterium]